MDLSVRGGRISSDTSLATGTDLELHLYLPDQEWPVEIAGAKVQWAAGTEPVIDSLMAYSPDLSAVVITLEDLGIYNMWETSALVEVLERKEILTKQQVLDMIQELRWCEPTAIPPRQRRR